MNKKNGIDFLLKIEVDNLFFFMNYDMIIKACDSMTFCYDHKIAIKE